MSSGTPDQTRLHAHVHPPPARLHTLHSHQPHHTNQCSATICGQRIRVPPCCRAGWRPSLTLPRLYPTLPTGRSHVHVTSERRVPRNTASTRLWVPSSCFRPCTYSGWPPGAGPAPASGFMQAPASSGALQRNARCADKVTYGKHTRMTVGLASSAQGAGAEGVHASHDSCRLATSHRSLTFYEPASIDLL